MPSAVAEKKPNGFIREHLKLRDSNLHLKINKIQRQFSLKLRALRTASRPRNLAQLLSTRYQSSHRKVKLRFF